MFLLNSQLTLFTVSHQGLHPSDHPLSRSYGVILPSSLTGVLSSALGFSPCLPVSACGTVTYKIPNDEFSRQRSMSQFALTVVSAPYLPPPPCGGLSILTGTSSARMA